MKMKKLSSVAAERKQLDRDAEHILGYHLMSMSSVVVYNISNRYVE